MKLIDFARKCPTKWAKESKQGTINLALYGYAAMAELESLFCSSSDGLQGGELLARVRHIKNVFEVCCANSEVKDFSSYGWVLARDYAFKVENKVSLAGTVCPRVFRLQTWSWHSASTHGPSKDLNQRNWSRRCVQHTTPAQLLTNVSMKLQTLIRPVNVVMSVATAENSLNRATNIKKPNAPRRGMGLLGSDSLVRRSSHSTLSLVGPPIPFHLYQLHRFNK